jgi:hypothetical protein
MLVARLGTRRDLHGLDLMARECLEVEPAKRPTAEAFYRQVLPKQRELLKAAKKQSKQLARGASDGFGVEGALGGLGAPRSASSGAAGLDDWGGRRYNLTVCKPSCGG